MNLLVISNIIGVVVNTIMFFANRRHEKKLRTQYRLDEALDDYWFRAIFVDEMSKSIKSIAESHISRWESIDEKPFSFGGYLQHSLQADFDDFLSQVEVISSEFDNLPESLIRDVTSAIEKVDSLITTKCCEYDRGDPSSQAKKDAVTDVISSLRLLPSGVLVALMKAHRAFINGRHPSK